jgi:hypothetical protein
LSSSAAAVKLKVRAAVSKARKALSDGGTQVGKNLKLLPVLSGIWVSVAPAHAASVRLRQFYGILPVCTLGRAGLVMVTVDLSRTPAAN